MAPPPPTASNTVSNPIPISATRGLPLVDLKDNLKYLTQLGTDRGFVFNEEVLLSSSSSFSSSSSSSSSSYSSASSDGSSSFGYFAGGVSPSRLREWRRRSETLVDEIRLEDDRV
ncbi:hypothetical protein DFJ77DRAFT_436789 [Powellomyces hirtus]|nr:hypothetical protein DFJ77DRAFT_436789 [Powellomyces hirtus]